MKKFNKLLTVGKIPSIEGMSVEPLQRFNAENIDVGMTIHALACRSMERQCVRLNLAFESYWTAFPAVADSITNWAACPKLG